MVNGICKLCNKERHDKRKQKTNEQVRKRWISDVCFRLKKTLRGRLREVLKESIKQGSFVKNLGCTIEFLKKYIESKFYENMTWNNWGTVWELDHKIALWRFDLTNKEQFLTAANYTNLQPLLISEHLQKSAKDLSDWHKLH